MARTIDGRGLAAAFIAALVVLWAFDVVWHRGIFQQTYVEAMGDFSIVAQGQVAPRAGWMLLTVALGAAGFTWYLLRVAAAGTRWLGSAAGNGALLGALVFGLPGLWGRTLVREWDAPLAWLELAFGLLSGLLAGIICVWLHDRVARGGSAQVAAE